MSARIVAIAASADMVAFESDPNGAFLELG
jgi:hypothetical protein